MAEPGVENGFDYIHDIDIDDNKEENYNDGNDNDVNDEDVLAGHGNENEY